MRLRQSIWLLPLLVLSCVFLMTAAIPNVPTGTWQTWNPMGDARSGAAAVLLHDGRVLFIGGNNATGPVASADLFGTDGVFSAAAVMHAPRAGHTATVLSDGRVLVAGGTTSGGGITNSAEIYDPSANSWTLLSGTMVDARSGHTASLLPDGRVLLAGGQNSGGAINSLEIFDPPSGGFSGAGVMTSARMKHAAASLQDGRVLIVGGFDGINPLASSDIFDPSAGTSSAGPNLAVARYSHSATTLMNGQVAVIGGAGSDGNGGITDLASSEIFDPIPGTFSPANASLVTARQEHQAFLLPNNNAVLIVGGTTTVTTGTSTTEQATASSELFTPQVSGTSGAWNYAISTTGTMNTARAGAVGSSNQQNGPTSLATPRPGVVMVGGGTDANGNVLASTEAYGYAAAQTDQSDYPPGTVVNISGSGFAPGETVAITLVESPLIDTHGPYTVVADGNGNIADSSFTTDVHDVNVRFWLDAVGTQSGFQAQNTFTDAAPKLSVTSTGPTGSGTVTSADTFINCAAAPAGNNSTTNCQHTYGANFNTTLTATANSGFAFVGWSGNAACAPATSPTCPASATGNNTFSATATFAATQAPAITSASSTTFTVGSAGSFSVTSTGIPTPTLSESGSLPTGVTFNASTGLLSGTPAAGTGGTYTITITASNGVSPNATQNFTLTVDQAPAITSAASTTFTAGTPGSFTVGAMGFPTTMTFSETGALPSGVTLTSAGLLSGTPAAGTGGTYPITITASNGVSPSATQNFTLTVDQAPAITSTNNATFTVGTAGSFTVTATGFPAPALSETGTLPSGVTLTSAGLLSGTPAAGTSGTYPITVTAANGTGSNATQSFTLTVNQKPAITSATNTTFTVGAAGTFTVSATGFPTPTLSESGTLPNGITFTPATGVLSGTPAANAGGTYSITFTAANGVAPNATQTFALTIDQAPAITSGASTMFTVGTGSSFAVTASGFPTTMTFSETGTLPSGVTLSPAGALSGTPAAGTGGTYSIVITASNGVSPNATQNFTLTVNQAPAITSANSATFLVNIAGSFTFTATGFPAPTFSESGSLPSGVTLSSSGVLSATAATTGNFPITVTASNGVSPASTQSFTLTIGQAPSITSSNNASFTVNSPASFTVTATGFPAPTFSETGALPSGVTLTSAGVLSGTPALGTVGSYPITITASNGVGANASQGFTLTVSKVTSSFTALTTSQTIPYGQASISLSGKVNGYPMMTGTVTITINGTSVPGIAVNGNPNNFGPVTFNTSTIPASATPYIITYAYSGDANSIPISDTSTTLTVNTVTPTVTWTNPAAITYGTALSGTQLNATFTAPFNGGTATVPGIATYTPAAGTVLNVGTNQGLSVNFVPTDTTDYSNASKTVQINVNPAATTTSISAPTVTFNNNGVVTVTVASAAGTPTGTASLTVDSGTPLNQLLNGSGVATFTLTSPAAGTHSLSASYTAQGNFAASSTTGSLQVNYAAPTLTVVNASSGNLNSTLNVILTGTGFFNGVTTVSFGADITVNTVTVNSQNQITANITIPANANVGAHNVSVTNGAPGGGTATLSGAFTVNNPATTTQVLSSENPSTYGDLVTFTATVSSAGGTPTGSMNFYDGSCGGTLLAGPTSLVNGQSAFQTSALTAGMHSIFACYTPTGIYLASSGSVSQQVNQAQATLSFGTLTFGYDGNPKPITVITSPLNLTGVSILYNGSPTPPADAGSTPVSATLTNANYTATPINGTEVIQPAPVMITVTDPNVTYDGNPHQAMIGVVPPVSFMVTYNGSPTAPTSAGIYSIVVTVTQPNYTGTGNGTLTVNKATPTINWANPADITYGTALSGAQLNATASFGLGGPAIPGTFNYNPASGTVLPAGDGQMLSADFAPTDSTDFNSVLGTTVLINVKTDPLYVISSDGSRSYGAANPTFTPTFLGFVNGDTASTIGNPTCASAATSTSAPGTYASICSGVTSSNYTVRYINGTLTVTNPLTAITNVTDTQGGTIQIGQTDTLTAAGQFADGNKRTLASAGGLSFSRADLTAPVSGGAIAEAGGVLYAIGGFDGSNTLGTIQAYSPKTNTWGTISATLATPRTNAAVVSIAGKIYVIGGNDAGGNPLTTIEVLDTTVATPAVSAFASSLTTARSNAAAAAWNQKLYVIAGTDASSNPLSSVEIFDLVTGNVSSGDTGTQLAQASAAVLTSNSTSTLYVVGATSSNVVALSTTDGTAWTGPTSTSIVAANGVGMVALNNLLYVVNGANAWAYDGTNFVQKNSLRNPHNASQPVAIGSRIYVASAGSGATSPKLDAFAPDEVTWSSADPTEATIDNSGNVQGVAITSPTVTLTATSIANQSITGTFALTVIKKSQTIQFGALTNATYGDPDFVISATSVDASTNPNNLLVSFAASPASVCTVGASVLSGSTSTATVHITGAGSCTITASQPGDATTWAPAPDVPQSFSVAKATPTVAVSFATSPITYDGNPHPATAVISGVNSTVLSAADGAVTISYTPGGSSAPVNAGAYSASASFTSSNPNYNDANSTVAASLTINKATAMVVVTPYTVTYDGSSHSATVTSITGVNGEMGTIVGTVTLNTTHTGAGVYTTDSWSFTGGANYNNIASTTITDTINKATAIVVVTPYTVTYDGSSHSATVTSITGVNSEAGATVGTVTLNTTHINAGIYATDSWSFTGGANYNDIASTAITDTINKAMASVTPNAASKVYGTADPLLTGVLSGFVAADNVTATYTRTAGQTVAGNPYTISATLSPAGALSNYNITYNMANFTITTAPLTITAGSGSMIYGGPVFPVTPGYTAGPPSGFVNGDTSASLTTQPTCGTTATSTSPVSGNPYLSSCSGAMDSNYTISYVSGAVTVQQATTTTTVVSSSPNNTSTFMQLVTFTATVTPQYAGTIPTGTVTFYNNGVQIGTGTPNVALCGIPPCPDQATFSTSALPDSGPDSITAVYSGDGNFIASTSPAILQTVQPAPNVSLSPLSVAFGNQNVNTTSKAAPVILTNIGDATLNISANGISITPSTDFAQTNNCGSSVAAGKSCTINITFTPIDTGIRTASLQITDNDDDAANAQQIVSLTGSGLSTIAGDSLYTDAIFATANGCGSIVMSGGSTVDSFTSTQGYSTSHQLSGGNVGTNGNVTLNGSKSAIYGSAAVDSMTTGNCSKTAVTGVTTNGGAQVTGGLVALGSGVNYPTPPAPNPAPPTTTQNISGSCGSISGCANMGTKIVVLAPGQYGNLSISGGTTAHFSKGTYNINSLTLSGQSILYVDSGPVIVNLAGASLSGANPAMDASGGSIQNPSGIPANLQFTYAGSRGVNLTGGSASYATVDAPNALVNMTGGSDFFGSIIASTVTNSGGTAIHYDRNLPAISSGNYIWFNAVVNNVTGLPSSGQVKLYLTNSTISFTAGGVPYTYNVQVPNAVVTFNSSTGLGTTYGTASSRWNTSVPKSSLTGNTFITGVAFPVPIDFPTGIQNVTWSASFSTDTPGITLQWQWGAAVYSSFSTNYATSTNTNVPGVNPEDGSADPNGNDAAGTPETYKSSVAFGATGGGGTNYTGYFTSGAGVVPTVAPMSVSPSSLIFGAQNQGLMSASQTSVLTNNDTASHMISSITTTGTNAGDFAVTHNCPIYPTSMLGGTSCTITVTFTPGDVGTRTAKIVVNDDANNTPQTVYLSGTGQ